MDGHKGNMTKVRGGHMVNGKFMPEPERDPLPNGTKYYYPALVGYYGEGNWCDSPEDHELLDLGLVHLTQSNADLHITALLTLGIK